MSGEIKEFKKKKSTITSDQNNLDLDLSGQRLIYGIIIVPVTLK